MNKFSITIVGLLLLSIGLFAQKLAPGIDIVGFGYDVFGKFADNSSKKPYQIFNLGADKEVRIGSDIYLVPQNVLLENIGRKEKTTVSGSNKREYAKSFGVSAGVDVDALTFGASVEASFSSSWGGSTQEYFYTIRDANRIWRIGLDKRLDLRTILDQQAQKDINTLDPNKLFDLYGTHVVVSAYLGGRADYNMVTKITSQYSEQDIQAAASVSYTKVSANVSTQFTESQENVNSNSKKSLTVTGGNAEYANDISNFEAYKLWADGIRSLPVLCDFDKGSLIPIWDLAATQSRKNALMVAFKQLCNLHPLPEAMAGIGVGMDNACFFIKSKSAGTYMDFPDYHFYATTLNGQLGLAAKDANNGGLQGADRFIKIIPHSTEPDYLFFQAQHANEVFEIQNGSKSPDTKVQLRRKSNESNCDAQLFKMYKVDGENNTYTIQNKISGLYLTQKSGAIVQDVKRENNDNQKWIFEKATAAQMAPPPANAVYNITLKSSNLNMDVTNGGGSESRLQLWEHNGSKAQYFQLYPVQNQNTFFILPMHNRNIAFDLHAGEGDPLRVFQCNSTEAQKFTFEWAGSPRTYKIKLNANKKYVTVDANCSSASGCKMVGSDLGNENLQNWELNISNNVFICNKYLKIYLSNISNTAVYCRTAEEVNNDKERSIWIIKPAEAGFVYIVNGKDGTLLNIENGGIQSTKIGYGSWSAMWSIEYVPGDVNFARIKNRWKGTYLNTEGNVTQCSTISDGWDSARWDLYYR